jgi:membrane protein implicated in regulation of membrane protease activity
VTRRSRLLSWGPADTPPLRHPYRDTLIVYGALAVAIVLIAWASGGNMRNAVAVAAVFYVVASAWGLTRWRRRLRERAAEPDNRPREVEQ